MTGPFGEANGSIGVTTAVAIGADEAEIDRIEQLLEGNDSSLDPADRWRLASAVVRARPHTSAWLAEDLLSTEALERVLETHQGPQVDCICGLFELLTWYPDDRPMAFQHWFDRALECVWVEASQGEHRAIAAMGSLLWNSISPAKAAGWSRRWFEREPDDPWLSACHASALVQCGLGQEAYTVVSNSLRANSKTGAADEQSRGWLEALSIEALIVAGRADEAAAELLSRWVGEPVDSGGADAYRQRVGGKSASLLLVHVEGDHVLLAFRSADGWSASSQDHAGLSSHVSLLIDTLPFLRFDGEGSVESFASAALRTWDAQGNHHILAVCDAIGSALLPSQLGPWLARQDESRLVVCPSGDAGLLPFDLLGLLLDAEDDPRSAGRSNSSAQAAPARFATKLPGSNRLGDRVTIIRGPSCLVARAAPSSIRNRGLISVAGATDKAGNLVPAMQNLFGSGLFADDATADAASTALCEAGPDCVMVIEAHGVGLRKTDLALDGSFSAVPSRGQVEDWGLAMAQQSVLTPSSDLNLSCGVVALACSAAGMTGRDGYRWRGMAPALLEAGASFVVAPLWPVTDDAGAADFVFRVVELCASGDAAEALAVAKRSWIETHPGSALRFASWVVTGFFGEVDLPT